jgi:hypothetical protein
MLMNTTSALFIKKDVIQQYPQWVSLTILVIATMFSLMISPFWESSNQDKYFIYMALSIGLMAGVMSYMIHLPVWWQRINSCFAFTILIFYSLHLPGWMYLIAFIAMTGLYWNTLVTRVPYYPSNQLVWEAVGKLLPDQQCRVLEIGSGLGGFSRYISKHHAHVQCLGLETAPIPWLASMVLSKLERAKCSFQRKNYEDEDFSKYDLIFAFLSPAVMQSLYLKAEQELNPEAKIISYMFAWPEVALPNVQTIQLANGESLCVYSTSHTNKNITGAL